MRAGPVGRPVDIFSFDECGGGWKTTAFCGNMFPPRSSFLTSRLQSFRHQTGVRHWRALDSGVKKKANWSADSQEGTRIIDGTEACFFGFSGASGRNKFKCSLSFPLFTKRKLNIQGQRASIGDRLPERQGSSRRKLGFQVFHYVGFFRESVESWLFWVCPGRHFTNLRPGTDSQATDA